MSYVSDSDLTQNAPGHYTASASGLAMAERLRAHISCMILATKPGILVCLSQWSWSQVQVDPHPSPLRGRGRGKHTDGPFRSRYVLFSCLLLVVIYKVPVRSLVKRLEALAPSYHLHMLAPHPVISVLLTRHEAGAIVGYFNL